MKTFDHPADDLPLFAAGVLPPPEAGRVARHLDGCAACRAEVDAWRAIAGAVRAEGAAAGAPLPTLAPVLEAIGRPAANGTAAATDRAREGTRPRPDAATARRFGPLAWLVVLLAIGMAARAALTPPRVADGPWPDSGSDAKGPGAEVGRGAQGPATRAMTRRLATPVLRTSLPPLVGPASGTRAQLGAVDGMPGAAGVHRDGAGAAIRTRPGRPAAIADAAVRGAAAAGIPPADATPAVPTPNTGGAASAGGADRGPRATSPTASPRPPAVATDTPQPPTATAPTATATPPMAGPTPPTPSPTPGAGGVAGRVLGTDGQPRAEIPVRAWPAGSGGDPAAEAVTDAAGDYRLALAPGAWLIGVASPSHQRAWWDGGRGAAVACPLAAAPVAVAAGQGIAGVDFTAARLPDQRIVGRVVGAGGRPMAGAMVVAAPPGASDPAAWGPVAFTDADGRYALALAPGTVVVGAAEGWSRPPAVWWGGATAIAQAAPITVGPGAEVVADIAWPEPGAALPAPAGQ